MTMRSERSSQPHLEVCLILSPPHAVRSPAIRRPGDTDEPTPDCVARSRVGDPPATVFDGIFPDPALDPAVFTAMICSGAVSAQFIAGKATRDALYLANLDVTSLPAMVVATAVRLDSARHRQLARPAAQSRRARSCRRRSSSARCCCCRLVAADSPMAPRLAARLVYLQISGLGPMLGSGFWLIATERFDPHTARQHFGQIAGVGTLGGLGGALVAERVAAILGVAAMLPMLAALNLFCAWQIRRLAGPTGLTIHDTAHGGRAGARRRHRRAPACACSPARRICATSPRSCCSALGAALVDYVFKVQAVEAFGRGDALLRFFALYYAATSLLAFVVQTTSSPLALEKLGLAVDDGTPSLALVVGGLGGAGLSRDWRRAHRARRRIGAARLAVPNRLRDLLHADRRRTRSARRSRSSTSASIGSATRVGGGLIRLLHPAAGGASQYTAHPAAPPIGCSAIALVVASRLNGATSTRSSAACSTAPWSSTSPTSKTSRREPSMLRTLRAPRPTCTTHVDRASARRHATTPRPMRDRRRSATPRCSEILALRSRNRDRGPAACCATKRGCRRRSVPHVIPLLAWDPVAEDAVRALRKVAEERVGELIDALLDPNQPFAVAGGWRACSRSACRSAPSTACCSASRTCASRCASSAAGRWPRSSRRIRAIRIDKERVFDVVRREVAVGRPVWESHGCSTTSTTDAAIVRRRVPEGPRRPEPGARLHAAVAGAADRAAADRLSRPAHRRPRTARHRARVSRRRAAAGHPRAALAVPRATSRGSIEATAGPATKSSPTCCARTIDHAEPRGAERARTGTRAALIRTSQSRSRR